MNLKDINSLGLEELKTLLKQVKKFKDLKTKLGKRGIDLFNRNLENKDLYVVEYFSDIKIEEIFEISSKVYKEKFGDTVKQSDINFIRNDSIKGGIKVYKNDSMVDISFLKIEKLIK